MADPRLKRLRPANELPPMYIELPGQPHPNPIEQSWEDRVAAESHNPAVQYDYRLSTIPRDHPEGYSRPLVHHNRRNYIINRQNSSAVRGVPGWLEREHGGTYKPGHYVLPEDTRSRPRYNPQETINMVKSSLLKSEKGRNVLRRAREIAFGELYNPTRRELERAENSHLFDLGYLNKRLLDWKPRFTDGRNPTLVSYKGDAELHPDDEVYQRRIPPTFDARRRYRLTKAQRNLPREAWGTDMDIPEENWNKKMRKARLEAGIGTQQFPELRVIDTK